MTDDEMFIWMTKQNAKQLIRVFIRWIGCFSGCPKHAIIRLTSFEKELKDD